MPSDADLQSALLIREVETTLLALFAGGRVRGTVHTCVGQEFSAVAFAGRLRQGDVVFSNHRCHGHYLAFTGDVEGLVGELLGRRTGVCGGVGGSQHLCRDGFHSNGIQGGIAPVAAGMALAEKIRGSGAIAVVFIGDGTLGEGAVYETLNLASKWELPLLVVCEDNRYAQSTRRDDALAGDVLARAEAFGIATRHGNTWDPDSLLREAGAAIDTVRASGRPLFFRVDTYRLNAHSKGDDDRSPVELEEYRARDPLIRFQREHPERAEAFLQPIRLRVANAVRDQSAQPPLDADAYTGPAEPPAPGRAEWTPLAPVEERQIRLINAFFHQEMAADPRMLFIGEDVLSPYGGAFKAAAGLSDRFPGRVFSTPISEAAITGVGNGLALRGLRPWVEIMFGDFITLALDQLANHAAKFHHMYNRQVTAPLVVRTPMGGRRGYGPTHSQSLEKLLCGIDQLQVVSLNTLIPPAEILGRVRDCPHPVVVLEWKTDYGRRIAAQCPPNHRLEKSGHDWPWARVRPAVSAAHLTLVACGGAVQTALDSVEPLFHELEVLVEILVPTRLHPLDAEPILESVRRTRRLLVLEEGSTPGGLGAEILARVAESGAAPLAVGRLGARPYPIPACQALEDEMLTSPARVVETVRSLFA